MALAALKATPAAALDARQSTPPLYILTLWAAAKLFGGSEAVLRSLSFLFGMGTVLLFWPLARRLVSRPASLLGLAIVACSPIMVYYSKELKQYSGDAFFAVLVFLLAERLRARQGEAGWSALALVGILGLGYSYPQVFILPVVWMALWFFLPSRQQPRIVVLGAYWVLAFVAYYYLFFRHAVSPELVAYWTQDFPDFSGLGPFFVWLGGALYRYFWYFLGAWGIFWGPPMLLVGLYAAGRQGGARALAYFGGPLLLVLGAAALHRYPFMAHYGGNRLMLFSAPLLYLLVAAGVAAVLNGLWQQRQRWLAAALAGLLLAALNPVEVIKENLHPLNNREEIEPLVAQLERAIQPQDLVYVYYFAISPFKYYFHGPLERVCYGKSCVETNLKAASSPPRRLWLIASHIPSLEYMRTFAAKLLGPHWRETACFTRKGAVLFRFERQDQVADVKGPAISPGSPESGSPAQINDTACE